MAIYHETGTAENYKDLMYKLSIACTTAPALVDAGCEWTVLRYNTSDEHELILKGKGNSGEDEIFVGMRTITNATTGIFSWVLQGYSGYIPGGDFYSQPLAIPYNENTSPALVLWNNPIPYDFVINGRRIIVSARVSTNDEMMYLGLLKNYGMPAELPYPMVVGGSANVGSLPSTTAGRHANFFRPVYESTSYRSFAFSQNGWQTVNNQDPGYSFTNKYYVTLPYRNTNVANSLTYNLENDNKLLTPVELALTNTTVYGLFDDCYQTGYVGISSGDIIKLGENEYKVFQNIHRTTYSSFVAIKIK